MDDDSSQSSFSLYSNSTVDSDDSNGTDNKINHLFDVSVARKPETIDDESDTSSEGTRGELF